MANSKTNITGDADAIARQRLSNATAAASGTNDQWNNYMDRMAMYSLAKNADSDTMLGFALGKTLSPFLNQWINGYKQRGDEKSRQMADQEGVYYNAKQNGYTGDTLAGAKKYMDNLTGGTVSSKDSANTYSTPSYDSYVPSGAVIAAVDSTPVVPVMIGTGDTGATVINSDLLNGLGSGVVVSGGEAPVLVDPYNIISNY